MADPVTLGMAVGGLGMQVFGGIKSSQAKADAAQKDAEIKRQEADEVDYRGERNASVLRMKGQEVIGAAEGAYTASGVELSGSALTALADTNAKNQQEIFDTYHEARFRAGQLRQGADVSEHLASDQRTAGFVDAAGTILGGGAKIAGSTNFRSGSGAAPSGPVTSASNSYTSSNYSTG
jgi:hypothetical protein